jgi:hypothetical protein
LLVVLLFFTIFGAKQQTGSVIFNVCYYLPGIESLHG